MVEELNVEGTCSTAVREWEFVELMGRPFLYLSIPLLFTMGGPLRKDSSVVKSQLLA